MTTYVYSENGLDIARRGVDKRPRFGFVGEEAVAITDDNGPSFGWWIEDRPERPGPDFVRTNAGHGPQPDGTWVTRAWRPMTQAELDERSGQEAREQVDAAEELWTRRHLDYLEQVLDDTIEDDPLNPGSKQLVVMSRREITRYIRRDARSQRRIIRALFGESDGGTAEDEADGVPV